MARNTLSDLNNHLFEQMERLNDEDLSKETLSTELYRTNGMVNISKQIIENANVVLKAQRHIDNELSGDKTGVPRLLGGEGE